MKLKARDLIPGWPRGRSTVVLNDPWLHSIWWWTFCNHPSERHIELKRREVSDDRAYHAGQSEMVERYKYGKKFGPQIEVPLRTCFRLVQWPVELPSESIRAGCVGDGT